MPARCRADGAMGHIEVVAGVEANVAAQTKAPPQFPVQRIEVHREQLGLASSGAAALCIGGLPLQAAFGQEGVGLAAVKQDQ